jgi:hypothetical protein
MWLRVIEEKLDLAGRGSSGSCRVEELDEVLADLGTSRGDLEELSMDREREELELLVLKRTTWYRALMLRATRAFGARESAIGYPAAAVAADSRRKRWQVRPARSVG